MDSHLWPHMKPESAYAKLKACVSAAGDERLSFGQVLALIRFCGQYERIVETIDNAAHVMQRAMQELNQLRRLRGVA